MNRWHHEQPPHPTAYLTIATILVFAALVAPTPEQAEAIKSLINARKPNEP